MHDRLLVHCDTAACDGSIYSDSKQKPKYRTLLTLIPFYSQQCVLGRFSKIQSFELWCYVSDGNLIILKMKQVGELKLVCAMPLICHMAELKHPSFTFTYYHYHMCTEVIFFRCVVWELKSEMCY